MNKFDFFLFLFVQKAESWCPQVIYFKTSNEDPNELHAFRQVNDTYFENSFLIVSSVSNISYKEFIRGEPTESLKNFNWKYGYTYASPEEREKLPNRERSNAPDEVILGYAEEATSCPTLSSWGMKCSCYTHPKCVCGREEFYEVAGPSSRQELRSNCCDVLHHRYNFATCGGGVKNRIGIFNKINETVYEFVACKEERLSYFIYVDKNVKRNRWTMGPNLNEKNRLQHTGSRANALCPNNIVSWFSLCETYTHSLPESRCSDAMWLPASPPTCAENAYRSKFKITLSAGDCCDKIDINAEAGADFAFPEALGKYTIVSDALSTPFPTSDSDYSFRRARKINDRVIYEKDSNSCKDKKFYLYYSAEKSNWHVSDALNASYGVIYGAGSPECPGEINNWFYQKNNTEGWTPTAEFNERTRTSIDRMNIMCILPGCCHKIDVRYNPDNPDPEKRNVTLTKQSNADVWVYNEANSNYTRFIYRSKGTWVYDNDLNPRAVLEQSDDLSAHCPDHTRHWHDFCECFREDNCWCGNMAWFKAPIPTCADPPKDECFYKEIDSMIALQRRQKAISITCTIFGIIIAIGFFGACLVAINRKISNRVQIQEQYGRRKLSAMSRTSFEGFVGAHSDASHLISS